MESNRFTQKSMEALQGAQQLAQRAGRGCLDGEGDSARVFVHEIEVRPGTSEARQRLHAAFAQATLPFAASTWATEAPAAAQARVAPPV